MRSGNACTVAQKALSVKPQDGIIQYAAHETNVRRQGAWDATEDNPTQATGAP
jgi:hypothetical protein